MKTLFILLGVFAITPFLYAQDAELEKYQAKLISAGKLNDKDSIAAAYSELSEYYSNRSVDSCRYYAEEGLEILQTKNSPLYASLLCNLGDAYFSSGNLDKAFHYFSMAHARAVVTNARLLSANLGVVCRQKEKLDSALIYYNEALDLLEGREYYSEQAQVLCGIALLYANQSRLDEGTAYGKRAVEAAAKSQDLDMILYANYSCGSIYFLQRRHDEGIGMLRAVVTEGIRQKKPRYVLKAYTVMLEMFKALGNRDSLDVYMEKAEAVIPQLPEESTEVFGFLEEQFLIYMSQGRCRESLNIQKKLLKYRGAGLHLPMDKLYLMMARNYRDLQEPENSMYYYDMAYRVCDSLHSEHISKELSDLTVKYDTREKELEIVRLNQVQLEQKAQTMRWIMATVVVVFILILFLLYYVFRRKRIKKEEELKLAQSYIEGLERERTRLAKELHDGVCNDLLGIGMNMQCMQPTDESKQEILALLEQVRSDVRCISHELMPPKFRSATLAETIEAYVERLVLPASVQLAFSKESEETQWSQVPEEVSYEVYRIMQELLSNILKHSGATEIDVTLTLKRRLLTLQVSDNGKNYCGSEVQAKGIGLTTIQERAKTVGGLFTVNIQDGSQKFRLEIPLSI